MSEGEERRSVHAPPQPSGRWLVLLILVTLLTYGAGIERPGRFKIDELFYMRPAAGMIWSGNWLYPVFEGHVRYQKPPLNYWVVAASYRLFGIHAWSARLPSVLLSALGVWLVWRLGLALFGSRRAALYGAAALLSSYAFYRHGRWAVTDVLLAVSMLGAFLGFARALFRDRRGGALWGWVCLGLAVLTKGPVGIAVPALALGGFVLRERGQRRAQLAKLLHPAGIALFLAMVLGWGLLLLQSRASEAMAHGAEAELARQVGASLRQILSGFAFYAVAVLRGLLPWALLLAAYRHRSARDRGAAYLVAWAGAVVLLFALLVPKHDLRYLVIAMPALALLAGNALSRIEEGALPQGALWHLTCAALAALFLFFLVAAVASMVPLGLVVRRPELVWIAGGLALAAAGFLAWVALHWRRGRVRALAVGGAIGIATVFSLYYGLWSSSAWTSPAWTIGAGLRTTLAPDARIATAGLDYVQRSWLSIGAARPVRNRDYTGDYAHTFADLQAAKPELPQAIVATVPAVDAMPAALRARYAETGRFFGGGLRLKLNMIVKYLRHRQFDPYTRREILAVLRRRE